MTARKTTRRDLLIGALWLAAWIAVPTASYSAWGWWKGEPGEVYADCIAFEAELTEFRAIYGCYPNTLEEAGINTQRAHSRVVSYENKGDHFRASLQGSYFRYSGVSGEYWDPSNGSGG